MDLFGLALELRVHNFGMVEQESAEKLDWVVWLKTVGFGESLRNNTGDFRSLEVENVKVLPS